MNTQETYEYIRSFFLEQGVLAQDVSDNGEILACAYRSEGGLKCAVGCLISDELYDKVIPHPLYAGDTTVGACIETKNVGAIIDVHPKLKSIVNGDDPEGQRKLHFLSDAQQAHDTAKSVHEFINSLDYIARVHRLNADA